MLRTQPGRRPDAGVGILLVRMPDRPKTADDVHAIVEERNIRFIRLWFTDVVGQLKSFSIHREELEDAFEGGMGFDGSPVRVEYGLTKKGMALEPTVRALKSWANSWL